MQEDGGTEASDYSVNNSGIRSILSGEMKTCW